MKNCSMVFIGFDLVLKVLQWDWESGGTHLCLFVYFSVINCRNREQLQNIGKNSPLSEILQENYLGTISSILQDLDNYPLSWCILFDLHTNRHKRVNSEKPFLSACVYAFRVRMLLVNPQEFGRNISEKINPSLIFIFNHFQNPI